MDSNYTNEQVDKQVKELIAKVRAYMPDADIPLLEEAVEMAEECHRGQKRHSGEPYVTHPIEVANILAGIKLDMQSLITAILHDTVEDTETTIKAVEGKFGKEIASLVDGVTKLDKIRYASYHKKQAENFRKLLLATSDDIRVLLVKLADRLHNMRTISHMPDKDKRLRKAYETMDIYAPLAERLGLHKIKNELQDLAFSEINPEMRKSIINRLKFIRKEGSDIINVISNSLVETLSKYGVKATVFGREKAPCSIWYKMQKKKVGFEQLSDIIGFRVLVDSVEDCYKVLGILHTHYAAISSDFTDYISTPKMNGYQSLHTVVIGPQNKITEVQIRTHEMHEVAEMGIAAHWAYKQETLGGTHYKWVRELLDILGGSNNPRETIENTKIAMYYDQTFCFTPDGNILQLPKGSTPVDFAFAVHTDLGLHCIGAKINGRIASLKTELKNGDQVEILKAKAPMPSPMWEKFVVTGKAKSEIRRFINNKMQTEYETLGTTMLSNALSEKGKKFSPKQLNPILANYGCNTPKKLLEMVGSGKVDKNEVLNYLYPEIFKLKQKKKKKGSNILVSQYSKSGIKGINASMSVHFATCCNPLPGDRIVGIMSIGKGITVHVLDCDTLENFANTPSKWIDVEWDTDSSDVFISKLNISVKNEAGVLLKVIKPISEMNLNIANVKCNHRSEKDYNITLDIEVSDAAQLESLINRMYSIPELYSVERYKI